ncbi:DUF2383 domain-containing protein [Hoeflea sp.]|uniref:DUF2383 domain-containing protein n=1 Tax=Hoeflea sp. TaxID=1940281 RepID=UPI003B524CBC
MSASPIEKATIPIFDAMETAREALVDAVHGLDVMLEKSEPEMKPVLADVRNANQQQADELGSFLKSHDRETPGEGSYMSAVHEGVVRARSLVTGIDEGVLPAVADGQRRLVAFYDDAIEQLARHMDELPRDTFDRMHTILTVHRGQLEEATSRIANKHRAFNT